MAGSGEDTHGIHLGPEDMDRGMDGLAGGEVPHEVPSNFVMPGKTKRKWNSVIDYEDHVYGKYAIEIREAKNKVLDVFEPSSIQVLGVSLHAPMTTRKKVSSKSISVFPNYSINSWDCCLC